MTTHRDIAAENSAAVAPRERPKIGGALAVAAGIFASKILGLARTSVFAHYLGNSAAAGAFNAALRIPNFLQNLFGEGALSASFIPVYARLLAEGREEEARRVAGTVITLLAAVVTILAALGMLASGLLVEVLARGFQGETKELAAALIRITFPGTALLVLSAWCLGILNSHRRFFAAYAAPVLWNVAIIAVLTGLGAAAYARKDGAHLAHLAAYGTVVGAAMQFCVQLPLARRLAGGRIFAFAPHDPAVKTILRNFGPALMSRGVVQISALLDGFLASYIGEIAASAIGYAQTLYMLPFSLIGGAMAAAELPEMARAGAGKDGLNRDEEMKARLRAGTSRIVFFIAPAVAAFVVIGDVIVATLFLTGRFGTSDVRLVHAILAAMSVGLAASSRTRLIASVFWALGDQKTPLKIAVIRIALATILGLGLIFGLREILHLNDTQASAGLVAASAFAAWVENILSRRRLAERIGVFNLDRRAAYMPWLAALIAVAVAFVIARVTPDLGPRARGVVVLIPFAAIYAAITYFLKVPTAVSLVDRQLARFRRR